MRNQMMMKKKAMCKKGNIFLLDIYRVTMDMKIEFVEKVKKLSNEGLTQMVQQI